MKLFFLLVFLTGNASAATRNFIPRGTGEGDIGLSTRTWRSVWADNFYGDGSALTGVITSTAALQDDIDSRVLKAGDTMTGDLALPNLTATYGVSAATGVFTTLYGDGSGLTGVIQSTATGYYPLWVATATYALNGVVDSTAVIDGLPIGTFITHGSTTPPEGYLYCDGTNYSTTTYSALFEKIGYAYGGSGANFTCDFRGYFMRGLDEAGLRDAEARVIGSTQMDTFQGHAHDWTNQYGSGGVPHTYPGTAGSPSASDNLSLGAMSITTMSGYGTPRISTETRPKNIAAAVHVKYAHVGFVAISSSSLLIGGDNTFTGANTFQSSVTVTGSIVGNTNFSGTASTTTFAGWVDIGLEYIVNQAASNPITATCPAGKKALGGGCSNSSEGVALFLADLGETSMRCLFQSAGTWQQARVVCARVK